MFKSMAGIDIVGVSKAIPRGHDPIAGHVSMMFTDTITSAPCQGGQADGIRHRQRQAPTCFRTFPPWPKPGYRDLTGWLAVFAPAGTPDDVVAKLDRNQSHYELA